MFLAYAIVFILVCVLALLLLLWAAPRRYQVKITRTLPSPPDRVWAYLSGPERYPHWFPYVASCEHMSGPARGVGQRRRVKIDRNGRLGEREDEVVSWEENRHLELDERNEILGGRPMGWRDARAEYRLQPAGEGTALTAILWFYGRGLLGGVFSLLFFRKRHEKDLKLGLTHLEKRLREERYPA